MKVTVYVNPNLEHHEKFLVPFGKSIAKAGHDVTIAQDLVFRFADLIIFWGHGPKTESIRERQIEAGRDYLVAEAAVYGEQLAMVSLGYNGCRGEAEYVMGDDPDGRAKMLGLKMVDWPEIAAAGDGAVKRAAKTAKNKLMKKKIIVMGQFPGDSSLSGVDFDGFVHDAMVMAGKKGVFRKHPRGGYVPRIKCNIHDGDMGDALKNASCVVTMNDTAAVEAVLAGVPVVAMDPRSMAYDVAGHSLEDMKNPATPDREEWFKKLAFVQWTPEELADGTAWKTVGKKYGTVK
jgi:hypothetical protein